MIKVGDLVNDTRYRNHPTHGKAGLVLHVDRFDSTAHVQWSQSSTSDSSPAWWVSFDVLESVRLVAGNDAVLAYSSDPM